MTIRLPPGHHLLRLSALTPANCGDAAGSAAVDRPVARDTWHDLPYLPSAALKGVLAGRRGNVTVGGAPNVHRTELFGAPDDDLAGGGRASQVIFGDGEPLAFPVMLREGQRARVVVAATVYRLAALGLIEAPDLLRIEAENAYLILGPAGSLPPLRNRLQVGRFGLGPVLLRALAGGPEEEPLVVAAPVAAQALWLAAAEQRTLTALGPDRRVRSGSLRTVELIPAGSVFLSLVSNLKGAEVDLGPSAPVQLGAWEGIGLGYFETTVLAKLGPAKEPADQPPPSSPRGPTPSAPHEVMLRVFEAMQALRSQPEASRVRSAIYDLGPRLRQRGLPSTLAFCLAKAGGGDHAEAQGSPEATGKRGQRAYRWVLRQLFPTPATDSHADLSRRVVAALSGESELPIDFEPTRLWLRRYAETMLPKESADG